jgi:hypothetical protein
MGQGTSAQAVAAEQQSSGMRSARQQGARVQQQPCTQRGVHAAEHTRRLTRAALASSGSFGVRTATAAAAAFGVPPAALPPLRRRLLAGVSLLRLLLAARLLAGVSLLRLLLAARLPAAGVRWAPDCRLRRAAAAGCSSSSSSELSSSFAIMSNIRKEHQLSKLLGGHCMASHALAPTGVL